MNRCEFESFVLDNYNACADFPWYIILVWNNDIFYLNN